jgi:hypothetical protein
MSRAVPGTKIVVGRCQSLSGPGNKSESESARAAAGADSEFRRRGGRVRAALRLRVRSIGVPQAFSASENSSVRAAGAGRRGPAAGPVLGPGLPVLCRGRGGRDWTSCCRGSPAPGWARPWWPAPRLSRLWPRRRELQ